MHGYPRTPDFSSALGKVSTAFASLLFLTCSSASLAAPALDAVCQEDRSRLYKFDLKRNDPALASHTNRIADIFSDPTRINYKRSATEQEKKRAFKAVMGSVMAHDAKMTSLYKTKPFANALHKNLYEQQVFALNQVDMATRILWGRVQRQEQLDFQRLLKDVTDRYIINANTRPLSVRNFNAQALLTSHFISWFEEALVEHFPERNFFAGKATREWFEMSSDSYIKGNTFKYTKNKFELIRDDHFKPVAVYKQLTNQSGQQGARNRQIKIEYVSWLMAKAMGLTDVVNPVIPVRKTGAGFVIDPFNYDGSLEPIAAPLLKDEKNALSTYGKLKDLMSAVLCYSNHFFIERQISLFQKERMLFFSPSLISYSHYFSGEPKSFGEREASFLNSLRTGDPDYRMKDLQTFRESISLKLR